MEMRARQNNHIQSQENILSVKYKAAPGKTALPQAVARRPVLGDIKNVPLQAPTLVGKVTSDFEKKAMISNRPVTRSYKNIQPKVNTGLSSVNLIPSARPPIRPLGKDDNSILCNSQSLISNGKKPLKTRSKENIAPVSDKVNDTFTKPFRAEVKIVRKTFIEPLKPRNDKRNILEQSENGQTTKEKDSRHYVEKPKAVVRPQSTNCSYSMEMLGQVEDIDLCDGASPQLVSIYIKEIYKYLNDLERKYRIRPDHLSRQEIITGKMRALLVDWLTEVHVQFALLPETFQLSIAIIDRYLQEVPTVQRNDLQLIGVTSVFLASKYEEIYAPDIGDFVYVSDDAYKKRDILRCERDILKRLNFSLGSPIPLHFLRRFVKAANGTIRNHIIAKYFIDLCLVEYGMCRYLPSELAAGALLLSLGLLSSGPSPFKTSPEDVLKKCWSPTLYFYTGYHFEGVLPIAMKIALLVKNVDKSKYQAVYKKYLSSKFGKASMQPELKSQFISQIVKPLE